MIRHPITKKALTEKNPASVPVSVVVLCGGLGTRLRPAVWNWPKVLAPMGDKVFLDFLLEYISKQGFRQIIMCIGYLGEMVKNHFKNAPEQPVFSEEHKPLGTGGAVKQALPLIKGRNFLVINGDTFCRVDLKALLGFHEQKQATMTMVLAPEPRNDTGKVGIDADQRISNFNEKAASKNAPYMNAGIYVFKKTAFSLMPKESVFSLEHDFFPRLIKSAPCFGYIVNAEVMDIGTPQRYAEANFKLEKLWTE